MYTTGWFIMSIEREKYKEHLQGLSAKELTARSHAMGKFLGETEKLQEDLYTTNPKFDISDPQSPNFVDNALFLGKAKKGFVEKTIPGIQARRSIVDELIVDKIAEKEKRQLDALNLDIKSRNAFVDHLSSQADELEELTNQGYLTTNIPYLLASRRRELVLNGKEENQTPEVKEESREFEKSTTVTLPNGAIIEDDQEILLDVIRCLVKGTYDKREIAKEVLGDDTVDNLDIVTIWIDMAHNGHLANEGYQPAEVQLKSGKVVLGIINEETADEDLQRIQAASSEKRKNQNEKVNLDELQESRYQALEYIFSADVVTSQGILSLLGTMADGTEYTWTKATFGIRSDILKIYRRVRDGVATERDKKIYEATLNFIPDGLKSTYNGFLHFYGKVHDVLKNDTQIDFKSKSLRVEKDKIAEETQEKTTTHESSSITDQIVDEASIINQSTEEEVISVDEESNENTKRNDAVKVIAASLLIRTPLTEEQMVLCEKIASVGTSYEVDVEQLEEIRDLLSDDEQALDFIDTFDDSDMQDLLFLLTEHSELFDSIMPKKVELDIDPNGRVRFADEMPIPQTYEYSITKNISNIRERVQKAIESVSIIVQPGKLYAPYQVEGLGLGIDAKDVAVAARDGFIKEKKGKIDLDLESIITLVVKRGLGKQSLTSRMKKELRTIVEEEVALQNEEKSRYSGK